MCVCGGGGLCVGNLLCDVALWNQFVEVESWLLDFYCILPSVGFYIYICSVLLALGALG